MKAYQVSGRIRRQTFICGVLSTLLLVASCYRITLVQQPHEAVVGQAFTAKLVVKRSGSNSSGSVTTCHGLFAVRVPEGWSVGADIVMTQVASHPAVTIQPFCNPERLFYVL